MTTHTTSHAKAAANQNTRLTTCQINSQISESKKSRERAGASHEDSLRRSAETLEHRRLYWEREAAKKARINAVLTQAIEAWRGGGKFSGHSLLVSCGYYDRIPVNLVREFLADRLADGTIQETHMGTYGIMYYKVSKAPASRAVGLPAALPPHFNQALSSSS